MMDYHRQNEVDIRIVRIFNTYGPRMALNDGRVMSNFITQALRGQPLTIYGDGNHTRSFCYVSDMVKGMIAMMEQDEFTGPVNLGNPRRLASRSWQKASLKPPAPLQVWNTSPCRLMTQ